MKREWVQKQFGMLLPVAVRWVNTQQRRILQHGVALSGAEIEDAKAVGVREPSRVRLLSVRRVPWPGGSTLRLAGEAIGFRTGVTRGLTLGYGIFIREDCWRDRALIAHELAHTAQYENLGGIEPFLRQYLGECLTVGYENSPLELEAARIARNAIPEVDLS
jgi:hypothetical protein